MDYKRATYNNVHLNVNLSDNTVYPTINLGDMLDIPTIPFIWHREECFAIPIEVIIKITKYDMTTLVEKYIHDGELKKIIYENIGECYIVGQHTVLEKSNYYISYHGFMYRHHNVIDENNVIIPKKYNKHTNYKCIICPIDNCLQNKSPLNEQIKGSVFIHGQAFSPPFSLYFALNEELDEYCFIIHGVDRETNNASTVFFIMTNEHKEQPKPTDDNKSKSDDNKSKTIDEIASKFVHEIINSSIKTILTKTPYDKIINIIENRAPDVYGKIKYIVEEQKLLKK